MLRALARPEVVTETAVYSRGGQYAFHRVRNDVFAGSERVYYIDGDAVFGESGTLQFQISGVWWYAPGGVPTYYQHCELTDEADLEAQTERQAAEEADAAKREAEKAAEQKARENKKRVERRKRGTLRNLRNLGGLID